MASITGPFFRQASRSVFTNTPRFSSKTNLNFPLSHSTSLAKTITSPRAQSRLFSTTIKMADTKLSADVFLSYVQNRRTYYALSKDVTPLSPSRIDTIVQTALQAVPSSFNSQSNRVVVLHGDQHTHFWSQIALPTLKAIVPAEQFPATEQRLAAFEGAAGTILFFEDQDVVDAMQAKFAIYADRFPPWAGQSDAMLQFALWTALEAEGLGANLQHYNPLVDDAVRKQWSVPESWKLNAQLVFGGKSGEPGEKEQAPIEQKFKSFGA